MSSDWTRQACASGSFSLCRAIDRCRRPPYPADIADVVATALAEDVGAGDLTAELIDRGDPRRGEVIVREPATLCGCAWFDETFRQIDRRDRRLACARLRRSDRDRRGRLRAPRARPAASVTGERTALNFLQTLSGTATATRAFASMLAGTAHARARHSQDSARTAARTEVRRALRRRREPSARSLRRDPDQGKPHRRGRQRPRGRRSGAQTHSPHVPLEVEVENLAELGEALDTRCGPHHARRLLPRRHAPRRRAAQRAAPASARSSSVAGSVSADSAARHRRQPASTSSRRRAHQARPRDRFLDALRLARSHRSKLRAAVRRDFGAPARRYAAACISRFGSAMP